jgi:hypothetical protein
MDPDGLGIKANDVFDGCSTLDPLIFGFKALKYAE